MGDWTATYAQHPALVTATGPGAPPTSTAPDATGTYAQHPAIVTRLTFDPGPAVAPSPARAAPRATPPTRRRRRRARAPRFTG